MSQRPKRHPKSSKAIQSESDSDKSEIDLSQRRRKRQISSSESESPSAPVKSRPKPNVVASSASSSSSSSSEEEVVVFGKTHTQSQQSTSSTPKTDVTKKITSFIPEFNSYNHEGRSQKRRRDASDSDDFVVSDDEDGEESAYSESSTSEEEEDNDDDNAEEETKPHRRRSKRVIARESSSEADDTKATSLQLRQSKRSKIPEDEIDTPLSSQQRARPRKTVLLTDDEDAAAAPVPVASQKQQTTPTVTPSQTRSRRTVVSSDDEDTRETLQTQSVTSTQTRPTKDISPSITRASQRVARNREKLIAKRKYMEKKTGVSRRTAFSSSGSEEDSDDAIEPLNPALVDIETNEDREFVRDSSSDEEEKDVRCICNGKRNIGASSGLLVQCSNRNCKIWQHARCHGYYGVLDIPTNFLCAACQDVPISRQEAAKVKARLFVDTGKKKIERENANDVDDDQGNDPAPPRARLTTPAVSTRVKSAVTALRDALAKGNPADVAAALGRCEDESDDEMFTSVDHDHNGETVLHLAVRFGSTQAVKLLIRKSNLWALTDDDQTPIQYAARYSRLALVAVLWEEMERQDPHKLNKMLDQLVYSAADCQREDTSGERTLAFLYSKAPNVVKRAFTNVTDLPTSPLGASVVRDDVKALRYMASLLQPSKLCVPDGNGLLMLHLAALNGAVECCRFLLTIPQVRESSLNAKTSESSYTCVMMAAEGGHADVLQILLEEGAHVYSTDLDRTSALHLAALHGHKGCVDLLIAHQHPISTQDTSNWPPILYAIYNDHFDCALSLAKADTAQLTVLTNLIKESREDMQERNAKVVMKCITCMAEAPQFFSVLNDFLRTNISLLGSSFNFLLKWKTVIDFDNKRRWLKYRHSYLDYFSGVESLVVARSNVLQSAFHRSTQAHLTFRGSMKIEFENEPGMCLGPRREFFDIVGRELLNNSRVPVFTYVDQRRSLVIPATVKPALENEQAKLLEFAGKLVGHAILSHSEVLLNVPLAEFFLKLVFGQPVTVSDFEKVDPSLYQSLTWMQENPVTEDLELTFSVDESTDDKVSTVNLMPNGDKVALTDHNKVAYVKALTKHKLEDPHRKSAKSFGQGLFSVIEKDLLAIFRMDELSLLWTGTPTINVDDMFRYTKLQGWLPEDEVICWFWELVRSLSTDELALLLKFITGSAAVPIGGFSQLVALNGGHCLVISQDPNGIDRIPTASTCFNMLKLSTFSSQDKFKKLCLIAIRHGGEGFSFS